jgi:hypothetical protein
MKPIEEKTKSYFSVASSVPKGVETIEINSLNLKLNISSFVKN